MAKAGQYIDDSFLKLVVRQLANDLDAVGEALLFERLNRSAACRQTYVEMSLQARMLSVALGERISEPLSDDVPAAIGLPRNQFTVVRHPVAWSIAGCAALFLIYFVAISWDLLQVGRFHFRQEVADNRSDGLTGHNQVGNSPLDGLPVATIRDSVDVQWVASVDGISAAGLPSAPEHAPASIEAGKSLAIAAGFVELQLKQGVTLVIEGPARWSIDGENNATLNRGKLVAKVPRQAIGFTLATPTAKIVDLGTEFGVCVGEADRTDLYVISGEVEATSLGGGVAKSPLKLLQGQSCCMTTDRPIELIQDSVMGVSFVRDLRSLPAGNKLYCVSQGKPVTASSMYDLTVPEGEVFYIENVVDGRINDSGAPQAWSFWLAADLQPAEFTVDLEDEFEVSEIRLQNTHNRQHNDRGTREYRLSLSLDGKTFVPIHQGELTDVAGQRNIEWVTIPIEPPKPARYVRFEAVSFYGVGAGLNELQVFAKRRAANVPVTQPDTP
jgi:hypothetical protein